jgi:NAD(P)-dependent dehydrogenase (short-subunit alcohol dehydrogenase family)
VGLPTYPFERRRFWVEPAASSERPRGGDDTAPRGERESSLYLPRWTQASRPPRAEIPPGSRWLLFVDDSGLGDALSRRLAEAGAEVCRVRARPGGFARLGEREIGIDPSRPDEYRAALSAAWGGPPDRVVHLFAASRDLRGPEEIERGFYSLIHLAQALSATDRSLCIDVVSSAVQPVVGDEPLCPERAALVGACRVLPQEMSRLGARHIDVPIPSERTLDADVELLLGELTAPVDPKETVIAYRGRRRWVETFARFTSGEPARSRLRRGGVYLITGGLGELGLTLAEVLVTAYAARVALVSRAPLPPRGAWGACLSGRGADDAEARRVRRLLSLERAGGEVLACAADVADRAAMQRVLAEIDARFGALHGVFHGAAVLGEHTLTPVAEVDRETCDPQFHGKVRGAEVLAELLGDRDLDFVLLHSSLAAVLGGIGMAAYAAANACLDALAPEMARRRAGRPGAAWISVDWDGLRFTEEAGSGAASAERSLPPSEIVAALERILAHDEERWVVSVRPLEARRATWIERAVAPRAEGDLAAGAGNAPAARGAPQGHARPSLSTEYVAPRDDVEATIAATWRDLFGIAEIGVHDDFFEIGGDSLMGIRVLGRVRESFQVDLHAAALFEHRTIAALAARVVDLLASRHAAEIGDAEMSALLDELERA